MSAKLTVEFVEDGKLKRQSFEEFPVLFGRNPECHLRLPANGYVSRVHGTINLNGDQIIITDLGSMNGLHFKGQKVDKISQSREVQFEIMDFALRMRLEGQEDLDEDTNIRVVPPEKAEDRLPSVNLDPFLEGIPTEKATVQGVITWKNEIYDVRNYRRGDRLILGPHPTEPIYLPLVKKRLNLGLFDKQGALIKLPQSRWILKKSNRTVPPEQIQSQSRIKIWQKTPSLRLERDEVLSVDLGFEMVLHLRYVRGPRLFISRTLIENKETFAKAVTISGAVHLVFSIISWLAAPPIEAPKIQNVPPRIAKLIVQPPAQILVEPEPPPPPPPVEPPPEPPPEVKPPEPPKVVETKPPPPKPQPKPPPKPPPPKPEVAKTPLPPPRPKPATTPPPPVQARPQPSAKPSATPRSPVPAEAAAAPRAPEPTAEERAQQELLNMLAAGPAPTPGSAAPAKIQTTTAPTVPQGVRVGGLAATGSEQKTGLPPAGSGGFRVAEAKPSGYADQGGTGRTGRRGVRGSVVGIPSLSPQLGRSQGLTNDEVMQVVNQHLSQIQQCYERALFDEPSLVGRVEYEWDITPQGQVSSARVRRSEIARGDALNDCVLALFQKMKFPAAKNGEPTLARIGFPFGRN